MGSESAAARPQPTLTDIVRQSWLLLLAASVIAGGIGFALSPLQPVRYQSDARLLLADPRSESLFRDGTTIAGDRTRYVGNQAEFLASTPVLERAVALIGSGTVKTVRERLSVRPSADLDIITIRASDPTAEGAAALANAVASAYQELVLADVQTNAAEAATELNEAQGALRGRIAELETTLAGQTGSEALQVERDAAVSQLVSLEGRARQIAVDAALYGSGVTLFEPAEAPDGRTQPKPVRNAVIAALLGLLAASALAWWRAEHARSIDGRQDAAPVLGAPLLGEVPDFSAVGVDGFAPALTAPTSPAGEAYQFLVAALEFALERTDGRTVVVTSARPGDGKTVTALNLAIAAARDEGEVLLVDADVRRQGLTRLTEISPAPGLTDLADEHEPLETCLASVPLADDRRLPVVPCGSSVPDAAGFFRTPGFRKALTRIRERADLTILDAPPLLAVADASAVASQADGIVIVVLQGTPRRLLEEVRERLDFVGTPVLGYVFNRAPIRSRRQYGYHYGSSTGDLEVRTWRGGEHDGDRDAPFVVDPEPALPPRRPEVRRQALTGPFRNDR